jgi:hypothetical protein
LLSLAVSFSPLLPRTDTTSRRRPAQSNASKHKRVYFILTLMQGFSSITERPGTAFLDVGQRACVMATRSLFAEGFREKESALQDLELWLENRIKEMGSKETTGIQSIAMDLVRNGTW